MHSGFDFGLVLDIFDSVNAAYDFDANTIRLLNLALPLP